MCMICTVMQVRNCTFDVDLADNNGSVISSVDKLEKLLDLMGVDKNIIQIALTLGRCLIIRNRTVNQLGP